ncbi:hypothetical protein I314_04251 [Cryptococcus bacillisporus CA1873]|uniref:Uncharacterized protein n=2 Tax=Cryptococcus gattii TaxID=552467 RepID=A0A0D0VJJ8_CRYGA|nr:hypothetical protein I312_04133 [Cryptococcus bacillisporus CA1280]KIR59818.1 hypothetical protein I314_04251 [Cryptococcus bacillisporus CA1873]|eukprot:KIR59818.1 hypothetical protein I314_04251 [Cryptococcus gattii CA1873]
MVSSSILAQSFFKLLASPTITLFSTYCLLRTIHRYRHQRSSHSSTTKHSSCSSRNSNAIEPY